MGLGLALAGGGAKATAHIGVLQAIEEEKINIDYISGTSSGSIIATLYAIGYSPREIMILFKKYCNEIQYVDLISVLKLIGGLIFKRKVIVEGLNNGKKIEKILKKCFEEKNIRDINQIKMPLIIPTVSLKNGELIVFSSKKVPQHREWVSDNIKYINNGDIAKIVKASCAFPGVFYPVKYNGQSLIDGGIRENIPWKELKQLGADKVITSCFEEKLDKKCCSNFIEVIERALSFSSRELANYEIDGVDYIIKTKMENIGLLNSSKGDVLYEAGYKEAKKIIKELNI